MNKKKNNPTNETRYFAPPGSGISIEDIIDSFPGISKYFPAGKYEFDDFYRAKLEEMDTPDSIESRDVIIRECKELIQQLHNRPIREQKIWVNSEIEVNKFLKWLKEHNPSTQEQATNPIKIELIQLFNDTKNWCFKDDPNPSKIKVAAFCQLVVESKWVIGNKQYKNKMANSVAAYYFGFPNLDNQFNGRGGNIKPHKAQLMRYFPNLLKSGKSS